VVSPSVPLRTGLSNHEQPFDKLRANGLKHVFITISKGFIWITAALWG
jgi:hypothetical protein